MTTSTAHAALASRLEAAWEGREPIDPLSDDGLTDVADAYAVQQEWTARRVAQGERIVGRKIGLTSRAVQEQMGVGEPDYGTLWASRHFAVGSRGAAAPASEFIQPRVEGEFAFLLGELPERSVITADEVLASTEAVAVAIEIVDSRIVDWRIRLADTVADNASYGGFAMGPWSQDLRDTDLRTVGMMLHRNDEVASIGVGAAALDSPANAVAWLVNKLGSLGVPVQAGDIVLSGAVGPTVPAARGDVFRLQMHGEKPLVLTFE